MKRKLLINKVAFVLMLFFCINTTAQVTIFSEDFEAASGPQNEAIPYLGWQTGQFTTTPPTNDNYFWVFDNTRCAVINGNYSMAVSRNNPVTTGTMPSYRSNRAASTLVYYTTPIDATNYTNLTLDFNWICEGEVFFDYGTVIYSLDGTTWAALPGFYEAQSTVQSVTNLDLSILDGQTFYLGFRWDNDSSVGNNPSFIIDDIDVKGIALTSCTTPNQPTVLNLTPTGDTIFGTFTAASPTPDNYLVVVSTSATPPTPVNTTSYNIGDSIGTGTVVDIDADTSFTATGLNPSTLYYIYVYSFNSICSNGPQYNAVNPLSGSATTTSSTYCTPATTNSASVKYINDVEFIGTLNDVSNFGNGFSTSPNGYQDFTAQPNSIQAQGEGINIYVGSTTGRGHYKAWVDWNKDGVFANDATETVYDSGGVVTTTTTFGFVIPAGQAIGDYRIRIRFHGGGAWYCNPSVPIDFFYNFDACETFDSLSISNLCTGNPNDTIAASEYGEAEDYLFTVVQSCPAQITSVTDGTTCGPGAATLQVTGSAGTTHFNWYSNETGGSPLFTTTIADPDLSPIISATTTYWVTAYNGSCESLVRTKIVAFLDPITSLTISPGTPEVCGEDDVIAIAATGDTEIAYLIDEDFEGGGLGVFTNVNNDANNATIDGLAQWQNRTSTYVPSLPNYYVWFPAISSGFGTNRFAMATSDVNPVYYIENSLESPVLNSSTFTDLTLNFDMYFSKYLVGVPEDVNVEVSTNGGTSWTTLQTYNDDVGYGTSFVNLNFDLSAYVNQTNLKIRIRYYAAWCDGVAVDNIQLYGSRPLNPSFTWTGTVDAYTDAATTIPYVAGNTVSTVYVKPTLAQLELASFTFTANATLSNGCTINKDITITNNTKIWKGTTNFDWDTASNWKPAIVPDSNSCVIIPDVSSTTGRDPIIFGTDGDAYNLLVKDGGYLTIQPGGTLTVVDAVTVQPSGLFELEGLQQDTAQLIQENDVNNIGSIRLTRDTNVRSQDYVYWSSPVENYSITNIPSNFRFEWIPTIGGNPGQHGDWSSYSGIMNEGQGYIVRGPNGPGNDNNTASWQSILFNGVPHNGDVSVSVSRGTFTGPTILNGPGVEDNITAEEDNWNLVGNPYPSAIDADVFINLNAPAINPIIEGTVYLWTHGTRINNGFGSPFYGNYAYNYNQADYTEYNLSGSSPPGFLGKIGSGQGFFIQMHESTASTSSFVTFNNGMRNKAYSAQFFRNTSNNNSNNNELERHRIWLDLVTPTGNGNAMLLAYVEGSTFERDLKYDAKIIGGAGKNLYSLIDNDDSKYIIQGRPIPFDTNDQVRLGIVIEETGQHGIAINTLDGLFIETNQAIFVEDIELGIIHDLRESPYLFTVNEIGIYDNRFVLRYTNESLGVDEFNSNSISVSAPNNEYIKITSGNESIESVTVYDMLGRVLINDININVPEHIITNVIQSDGTLFVKVNLLNGHQKIKKVVIKK